MLAAIQLNLVATIRRDDYKEKNLLLVREKTGKPKSTE